MATSNGSTKTRTCKVEDCNNPRHSRIYCAYHAATCHIDGCEKPKNKSGVYCNTHRYAIKKYGYEIASQNKAICSVPNCTSTANLGGKSPRCDYHKTTCAEHGCENPVDQKHFLCGMHSSRKYRAKVAASGKVCSESGCSLPVECSGLCSKHYVKLRRYGSVDAAPCVPRGEPLRWITRLVQTLPLTNECIEWPFNMDAHGYGAIWHGPEGNRLLLKAHRVSLAIYDGLSIDSLPSSDVHARHLCPNGHNKACVNPLHLAWGTHAENMADSVPYGTQKGSNNPASKLNEDQVLGILLDLRDPREIALDYPVSADQIKTIKRREQWQHVKLPHEIG